MVSIEGELFSGKREESEAQEKIKSKDEPARHLNLLFKIGARIKGRIIYLDE